MYDPHVRHLSSHFSAVIDSSQGRRLDCNEVLKPFKEAGQCLKLGTCITQYCVY